MSATADIFGQTVDEDYWEGYYALSDGNIVLCSDADGTRALFTVYAVSNAKILCEGEAAYSEGDKFRIVSDRIGEICGSEICLRLSDMVENPDRHDEIDKIIRSGEKFELVRILNLVRSLKTKSISILGGPVGGKELSEGNYDGFYLFSDGTIIYCRDLADWDDNVTDRIVDGVAAYRELSPRKFSLSASDEKYFGYLRGDRFSDLAEELSSKHGRFREKLAGAGTEMFGYLTKALEGDAESAAIAGHRLKTDLRTDFRR